MNFFTRTAAQNGDLNMLYHLISKNPNLLDCLDKEPFSDTPLHVAAQHGNVEFAMEIMTLKPSLARKLNQDLCSPMHLALQNRQIHMVHRLLDFEADLGRVRGKNGETPLHYLATKVNDADHQQQKISLLPKFISVCPLSIRDTTNKKETAFHIAVKHGNYDAFDILLGAQRRACYEGCEDDERKIINLKDANGDNVLHIATAMNQSQVVRLLLKNSKIDVNAKNSSNLTALDISYDENIDTEVREILIPAGALRAESLPKDSSSINQNKSDMPLRDQITKTWILLKNETKNESLNLLLLVAAMVAAGTFQVTLSPPGGVWQGNDNNNNNNNNHHAAGTVIMGTPDFFCLYVYNSVTFYTTTMAMVFLLPEGKIGWLLRLLLLLYLFCYILSLGVIWPYSTGEPISIPVLVMLMFYVLGIFGFLILHSWEVQFKKKNEQIQ